MICILGSLCCRLTAVIEAVKRLYASDAGVSSVRRGVTLCYLL